jgi:hypothetical protein
MSNAWHKVATQLLMVSPVVMEENIPGRECFGRLDEIGV